MKPSLTSSPGTTPNTDEHAPTDWVNRKGNDLVPFDIVILTQTPIESELDILLEHGGEPAAKYGEESRIYRLKDGRFAVMSSTLSVLNGAPPELEFWNWWAKTQTPSFSDLSTAREIDERIGKVKKN